MTQSVFTHGAPALKFGPGAADEIGHDLLQTGARRVLLLTHGRADGEADVDDLVDVFRRSMELW